MGLLDFYDDPAANMALAAGLLSGGNFGQALGKGMAGAQALIATRDERKRRNEYMQAQAENLRNEIEKRNFDMQKATRLQSLLDRAMGGAAVSAGAYAPAADGMGPVIPQVAPQGGSVSGLFDPQTLAALKVNGVDLVDVAKLAKPEWQNINGYLVNTNDPGFKGGFQPGMNTSANGQVTAWIPDGNGGFVVGAPKGALETYKAYQNAGKQAENDNTLAPLDRIDPATGRPYAATTGQLVRQVQGGEQALRQQVQGGNGNSASDYAREIAQTRTSLQNPNLDPASRKLLEDHLTVTLAQAQRAVPDLTVTPSKSTGFNGFAGPADTAKAVKQAEADVTRSEGNITKGTKANELLAGAQRARELLGKNPTESLAGAGVDKAASWFGATPKGADAASQLEALSGWMVSNVPRMEGPQSNFDVQNYQTMAGKIGDRTIPVSQRLAALNEVEALQKKYAALNNIPINPAATAAPEQQAKNGASPLPANPTASNLTRGQRYALPNGRVGVWDGMGFKAE